MRIRTILINTILIVSLTGCASYDFSRRQVQQGNLLPEAKIAQLTIGMSKENAANLMGTSLLSPTFENDRWDYVDTIRHGGGAVKIQTLTLYFKNQTLVRIERHP